MITQTLITLAADAPATAPTGTGNPTAVGYGGIVVGFALTAFAVARWRNVNKDAHTMFILGVVIAVLLGSTTGILGGLSNAVRQTGNSVGNSVTDTTTGK